LEIERLKDIIQADLSKYNVLLSKNKILNSEKDDLNNLIIKLKAD